MSINAPASVVWRALTDFKDYPMWNPFLRSIDGDLVPGVQLKVVMHPQGGRANTFYPRLEKIVPNSTLTWLGKMATYGRFNLGFLFSGRHYFILEERDGVTYLAHGENFSGLLIPLLARQFKMTFQDGFIAMNSALKERCESSNSSESLSH